MLQPPYKKFRKSNNSPLRIITKQYEISKSKLSFGTYGIQALERGTITAKQVEVIRRTRKGIGKSTKNKIKMWLRVFPDYPITSKPAEVRIGRGKGNVDEWVCAIKPGKILAEISASSRRQGRIKNLLRNTVLKLPIKTQLVKREVYRVVTFSLRVVARI